MQRLVLIMLLLLGGSGCAARQASGQDTLPAVNVTQCRSLCTSAKMTLQSIVVVANQTGCVCGPSPSGGSAATTGGAVAVMLAEAQQQQQQQQQQRQQQSW